MRQYIVFANGGVQEALVTKAFLSLFIIFRILKHPQSLGLRVICQSPMMRPSSSSKFGGAAALGVFKLELLVLIQIFKPVWTSKLELFKE